MHQQTRFTPFPVQLLMIALGAYLFLAAIEKAVDPRDTVTALSTVFPSRTAHWMTTAVIFAEIPLSSALLAVLAPRFTLAAGTACFLLFSLWILYLIFTGERIGCGCGGRSLPLIGGSNKALALARTTSCLFLSLFAWLYLEGRSSRTHIPAASC